MRKPELLAPAGDLARLRAAVDFGADAVYLAGHAFGMRTASPNFSFSEMEEGIAYAHAHGVKVHVACNTTPHNDEIDRIADFAGKADALGADAFIVGDLGTLALLRKTLPHASLHASVQSGVTNYRTALALYDLGVSRAVLARELTLEEIADIRAKTPAELELEAFVHGAMCVSRSGRCLLSSYMTGRDANRGDCAQPCRWRYHLVEEKRPGELYEIGEDEQGSYILNANDLCMAEHIGELAAAGVSSLKIEGRAKTGYYVAVTTNAYRGAIDAWAADPTSPTPDWVVRELNKISHRAYSTGFYFGPPHNAQTYSTADYIRDYEVAAVVEGYEDGCLLLTLKNRFTAGTVLDCLEPGRAPFPLPTQGLTDENGAPVETANRPTMRLRLPYDRAVRVGSLLRRNRIGENEHEEKR